MVSDWFRIEFYSAGYAEPPRLIASVSPEVRAAKKVITAQPSEQAAVRGEQPARQVVANGEAVQDSRSFATPNKGGTHRWYTRSDPGFMQPLFYRIFCDFEIAG